MPRLSPSSMASASGSSPCCSASAASCPLIVRLLWTMIRYPGVVPRSRRWEADVTAPASPGLDCGACAFHHSDLVCMSRGDIYVSSRSYSILNLLIGFPQGTSQCHGPVRGLHHCPIHKAPILQREGACSCLVRGLQASDEIVCQANLLFRRG